MLIEKLDPSELFKQDKYGNTPLHYAVRTSSLAVLLINKITTFDKSKLDIVAKDGATPLQASKRVMNIGGVEALLKAKLGIISLG